MTNHTTQSATRAPVRTSEFGTDWCARCGREIDTTHWRPATTNRDASGSLSVYVFCDQQCHDEWTDASDA